MYFACQILVLGTRDYATTDPAWHKPISQFTPLQFGYNLDSASC